MVMKDLKAQLMDLSSHGVWKLSFAGKFLSATTKSIDPFRKQLVNLMRNEGLLAEKNYSTYEMGSNWELFPIETLPSAKKLSVDFKKSTGIAGMG